MGFCEKVLFNEKVIIIAKKYTLSQKKIPFIKRSNIKRINTFILSKIAIPNWKKYKLIYKYIFLQYNWCKYSFLHSKGILFFFFVFILFKVEFGVIFSKNININQSNYSINIKNNKKNANNIFLQKITYMPLQSKLFFNYLIYIV